MTNHTSPFPGQVIRDVNFGDPTWYEENVGEHRPWVQSPDLGTVVTSEVADRDAKWKPATDLHKPVLDLDIPAVLLPSSTEGHFHLYIDKEMSWKSYKKLLTVLAEVGIIEEGYLRASVARKYTAVRLPWIKKEVSSD